jgi:hypothetical protein
MTDLGMMAHFHDSNSLEHLAVAVLAFEDPSIKYDNDETDAKNEEKSLDTTMNIMNITKNITRFTTFHKE